MSLRTIFSKIFKTPTKQAIYIMKISRILVDMDEVLSDFVGAAAEVHGVDRFKLEALRRENGWGMELPLSRLLGRDIGLNEFWEPIHQVSYQFWTGLRPLPWMNEILDLVKHHTDDWYIVSAPSKRSDSVSGKIDWLRKYLGGDWDRLVPTKHKHLLANPTTLLIDDREENIEKFVLAGGEGIVFPSHGNKFHSLANNPVPYVASILKEKFNAH